MGDAENALPASKKRAAGREISKENPGLDDDDSSEQETGTFKRASDEVLASRRIVKVRRSQTTSAPSSNPFAGIQLVPPAEPVAPPVTVTTDVVTGTENVSDNGESETFEGTQKDENEKSKESESKPDELVPGSVADKDSGEGEESRNVVHEIVEPKADDEKTAEKEPAETEKGAEGDEAESKDKDNGTQNVDPNAEGTQLSSFQQLSSSQNAFTGLAGTGLSTSTFTFGSASNDGSLFGQKSDQPSFGFGLSNNGSTGLFNSTGPSIVSKNEGSAFPSMKEVAIETGEENERVVFSADSVLFEFLDGTWKERGKGELKVNVSTTETESARVLMRSRGNYRLILNANLYPDMKLTNMDKRGITFACMNSTGDGKDGLSTVALKFKDASIVEEFRAAVDAHKGKTPTVLKTPENSPKASDE